MQLPGNQPHQETRLQDIISIDSELNKIQDLDILLERTLTFARRVINTDAGSIYIKIGDALQINHSQNDTLQAQRKPGQKLIYNIFTFKIDKSTISGYAAATREIVNIEDAYAIPDETPYSFDSQYDQAAGYRTRSMLAIPLLSYLGELLGVLQLINKKADDGSIRSFDKEDEAIARHFANNVVVALERAKMTRAILLRMILMAELNDPKETGPHVNRVAGYAVEIYEQWAIRHGLPHGKIERDKDNFRMAAMLHDVGKVALAELIKKRSSFTPEERAEMQKHTLYGSRLFLEQASEFEKMAMSVALNHHENWDGTGYPGWVDVASGKPLRKGESGQRRGKRSLEIPLYGRIVAIADVYDALRSQRSYKDAWTEEQVLDEIRKMSGTKFDPELVEIFFEVYPSLQQIADKYKDVHST